MSFFIIILPKKRRLASGHPDTLYVRTPCLSRRSRCCSPVFNDGTLRASIDTASCSHAPRLVHVHGCSFVLRFTSCLAPVARPWMQLYAPRVLPRPWIQLSAALTSLLARTQGLMRPRGPPSPMPPCRAFSWNTCNMKYLLQHTFETDEIFTTYVRNMYMGTVTYATSR
jgi:hypothetical protein